MTPAQLKAWRINLKPPRGITQRAAAEKLGTCYSMYRRYETGHLRGEPVIIPEWIAQHVNHLLTHKCRSLK